MYHIFEQVIQGISEKYECDDGETVDDSWLWNEVARYDLSPEGKLEEVIRYTVGESGIIWGYEWSDDTSKKQKRTTIDSFSLYDDLSLPTPFQAGDIITVDCRPFDKIYHAVVLDNKYPNDCCTPFCIYFKNFGLLGAGALKHTRRLHYYPVFSPLLRAVINNDELPEYEASLKLISEKISQNSACIDIIYNYFESKPWDPFSYVEEILNLLDAIK